MNDASVPSFSEKHYPLLHQVQRDDSIKCLTLGELEQLAAELRRSLIEIVQCTGGHLSSNLGVVELTIAMHYVFDSPQDAFLWDVGHQAYVHKMLTGRWQDFGSLRQRAGLSGFPRRDESLHDYLNTGHAGTAISAGLGLYLGRCLDKQGQSGQKAAKNHGQGKVLCVVGDASLTSGMAFEAMNHCGHQSNQLVVVMNDNEMSIAPNVGAVSRILSRLTAGHSYVFIRNHINQFIYRIPVLGGPAYRGLLRIRGVVKKAVYRNNLFTEFGFKYIGPIDGHNTKMLIDTFKRIAQLEEPVFLHLRTQKGKGLKEAEEAPAKYHGVSPRGVAPKKPQATFTESFSTALAELEDSYDELVCISAAMASSTGLQYFAKRHPERFFDVGIAEQHALTLACGLALTGKLPLVAIYSTFMQRALDQLIHDISLMNLPSIFICDRAGIVPGDGDTHQGIYDIAQFRNIIGLELYSPGTKQQLRACLATALDRGHREIEAWQQRRNAGRHDFRSGPVVIRLPKRNCPDIAVDSYVGELKQLQFFGAEGRLVPCAQSFQNCSLLLCSGSLLPEAMDVQQSLSKEQPGQAKIALDVLQLCQLAPLPREALSVYLQIRYQEIFCIEDGVVQGGVGEELLRWSMSLSTPQPIYLRGVEGKVPQMGNYQELLTDYGLDAKSLDAWVREILCTKS